ncbi:MAG: caspase family protein [Alphaproteobacteria bacterium]|nr:caspase family protein [Alphaproteobacteria bacterium]
MAKDRNSGESKRPLRTGLRHAAAWIGLAGCLAVAMPLKAQELRPVNRVALVIGNGEYETLDTLPNPPRDAAALAEALWNAGFEVIELIDADREQMINGIATFANRLRPGAEAVFYYAGHGVAVDNVNYLIPVATPVESEAQIAGTGIAARTVLQTMEQSGAKFNVVILDACRNNPFNQGATFQLTADASRGANVDKASASTPEDRGAGGGLAEMNASGRTETLVAYATAPGEVALDGETSHSPYTQALLDHLNEPGLEIGMLFRRVRGAVRESTEGYQIPWTSSTLEQEFYFRPNVGAATDAVTGMQVATNTLGVLPPRQVLDRSFWYSIQNHERPTALSTYLDIFPEGRFRGPVEQRLAMLLGEEPETTAELVVADDWPKSPALRSGDGMDGSPDEDVFAPAWLTSAPIGVAPMPLDLPALDQIHQGQFWVQLGEAPKFGQLLLEDGKAIEARDAIDGRAFLNARFRPTVGTHGGKELVTFSVLDQAGARHDYEIGLEAWIHACDMLAGMPEDTRRVTAGTREFILKMRAQQAIEVCELAVADYPESGRFAAELARAYRLAGRYDQSVAEHLRAIELGHDRAMVVLGLMHWAAQGVDQDLERARLFFEEAWERGESAAGTALAAMYREGAGVEQNYSEAMRWYQDAASRGNDWAMYNLGEMHETGKGVEPDIEEAVRWYTRAARSGELTAQYRLAKIYEQGLGVQSNQSEAERWYRTVAGQGVPNAMTRLGVMSERGVIGEVDLLGAWQLYRNAADLADPEAKLRLARLYRDGKGVEQDVERALALLGEAVDAGQVDALRDLGKMKQDGLAGPKDEPGALALYLQAAESSPWAARDAAKLLASGEQVERDLAAAADWHRRAAEGGVAWSARDLGRFYEAGKGVEPSIGQAVLWYATALADSDGDAKLDGVVTERLSELPPEALTAGAQLLLQKSGHAIASVDGKLGPETKAALERFRADAGLATDDLTITPELLGRLARSAADQS